MSSPEKAVGSAGPSLAHQLMITELGREMCRRKAGRGLEVIVHVQHVGQQGLGGRVDLLHLVLHLDGLQSELLSRPRHPEQPGDPLEEDDPDLSRDSQQSANTPRHHLPSQAYCGCGPSCGGS